MRLILAAAFLVSMAAAEKYACVYDCHLYDDSGGSARGYVEFECDPTVANCCDPATAWKKCIAPANTLYNGMICPSDENAEGASDRSAAKYFVGGQASMADDYARNADECPNLACELPKGTPLTECPTESIGCIGGACGTGRFVSS